MKTFSRNAMGAMTFVLLTFSLPWAKAAQFAGTVIVATGDVKILTSALKTEASSKKFVLYENKKYSFKPAKIGLRLRPGQVVLSGTDGRAKIAYQNGDHIIMAPGSSVSMPEPTKAGKDATSKIQLFYGKIRALISKKGPLNKMKVKTKSAVAGVRGTDFYMSYTGGVGTELTVLRGAVEIKKDDSPAKPTLIKTGFSAKAKEQKKKAEETLETFEASKKQLLEVQAASNIKLKKKQLEGLKKETREQIEKLEKKAVNIVLADVKAEDPELYKKLKKKKNLSESDINTQVVAKLYRQAPAPKKPSKANLEEIDQIGKDVYDKYFKNK